MARDRAHLMALSGSKAFTWTDCTATGPYNDVGNKFCYKEKSISISDLLCGLHVACANGDLSQVEYLLNNESNIDAWDIFSRTPLHYAARNGHLEVVMLLLEYSVNTNVQDHQGLTPLHMAVQNGYIRIAESLLARNADVGAQDANKNTPLHLAVRANHIHIVNTLIESEANINAQNDQGYTPLHLAVEKCYVSIVKTLIRLNANVHLSTHEGNTPLHLAACLGNAEIVKALIYELHLKANYDNNISAPPCLAASIVNSQNNTPLAASCDDQHREFDISDSDVCEFNAEPVGEIILTTLTEYIQERPKLVKERKRHVTFEDLLLFLGILEHMQGLCPRIKEPITVDDERKILEFVVAEDIQGILQALAENGLLEPVAKRGVANLFSKKDVVKKGTLCLTTAEDFSLLIAERNKHLLTISTWSVEFQLRTSNSTEMLQLYILLYIPPTLNTSSTLPPPFLLHSMYVVDITFASVIVFLYFCMLLLLCGDVETNPGPASSKCT